jgi:hypothetical protein
MTSGDESSIMCDIYHNESVLCEIFGVNEFNFIPNPKCIIEFDQVFDYIRDFVNCVQVSIEPYKKDSDIINEFAFEQLGNDVEKKTYNIKYLGEDIESSDYEFLVNNTMANKILELKVGTQVMCIANILTDHKIQAMFPELYNSVPGENQLVSGLIGIIKGFVGGLPEVKFNNIEELIVVDYFVWNSEVNENISVSQIPLIHATGVTYYTLKHAVSNCINVLTGHADYIREWEFGGDYVPSSLRNQPLEFGPVKLLDCLQGTNGDNDIYEEDEQVINLSLISKLGVW